MAPVGLLNEDGCSFDSEVGPSDQSPSNYCLHFYYRVSVTGEGLEVTLKFMIEDGLKEVLPVSGQSYFFSNFLQHLSKPPPDSVSLPGFLYESSLSIFYFFPACLKDMKGDFFAILLPNIGSHG